MREEMFELFVKVMEAYEDDYDFYEGQFFGRASVLGLSHDEAVALWDEFEDEYEDEFYED